MGSATVCGYDVVTQTASARKNVTYCPQHDVFFDDLNVEKHVYYYAKVGSFPLPCSVKYSRTQRSTGARYEKQREGELTSEK